MPMKYLPLKVRCKKEYPEVLWGSGEGICDPPHNKNASTEDFKRNVVLL